MASHGGKNEIYRMLNDKYNITLLRLGKEWKVLKIGVSE